MVEAQLQIYGISQIIFDNTGHIREIELPKLDENEKLEFV